VNRVYGRRIRQARRIRRRSVSAVAEAISIRQPRLSELEQAYVSDVSEEIVRKLGEVLDFPVPFFSVEPQEPSHLGSLLFRAKSTLTDTDADHLAEYAGAAGEIFSSLSEFASSPSVRLPELRPPSSPVEAARIIREQFGIKAEEPIDHLVRKAERAGILVIVLAFDVRLHDRLDAFSCWVGDYADRPVNVLRASSSWDRRRWSMAHEIGHAVLHKRHRDGDIEEQANQFACELLLPGDSLAADWPTNPTIMSLLPLKERWGLSIQALMEHGFRAGLLGESKRMSLYKQLSNRKWPDGVRWREREPGYNSRDPELPRMLGKMVEVGLGTDASLDLVSQETGYWPVLFLQELLGVQLARSGKREARRPAGPRSPAKSKSQVVSLTDWRRDEANKSYG
jgi:Zn-dependent peptidase ImmA (M78 family)/transcriptional regulator with XRE-family HTH domain